MNSKFTIWLNPDSDNRKRVYDIYDIYNSDKVIDIAEGVFKSVTSGDNLVVIENHANPKYCPTVIFDKTKH